MEEIKIREIGEELLKLIEEEKEVSRKRKILHEEIDRIQDSLVGEFKKQDIEISEDALLKAFHNLSSQSRVIPKSIAPNMPEEVIRDSWSLLGDDKILKKKSELHSLLKQEAAISYERRVLHGKIDLLRNKIGKQAGGLGKIVDFENQENIDKLVAEISKILAQNF